jgi:hypothetical protein
VKRSREIVEQGKGYGTGNDVAWPVLPSELNTVRRDLLQKMWTFGQEHKDQIFNPYITVAMAPYGPGVEL